MNSRSQAQLFLHRLEDRRVLSAGAFLPVAGVAGPVAETPAVISQPSFHQPAATAQQQSSSTNQTSPASDGALENSHLAGSLAEHQADRGAMLLDQATSLPAGSPGVRYLLQMHPDQTPQYAAEAMQNELDQAPWASITPTAPVDGGDLLDGSLPPAVDSLGGGNPALPDATPASTTPNVDQLLGQVQTNDPRAARERTAPQQDRLTASDSEQVGSEDADEAIASDRELVVSVSDAEDGGRAEAVLLDGELLAGAPSAGLAADLAAGDLHAVRRALERLLAEFGRLDLDGADAAARLELLLWLSSAAAAAAAGCEIARRQLRRSPADDAATPGPAASRPCLQEPLLA